jgi:hypothetical protein
MAIKMAKKAKRNSGKAQHYCGQSNDVMRKQLARQVRQQGWQIVRVFGDEWSLPFAFTVGLYENYGHPEIMMFLPSECVLGSLEDMAENVAGGGEYIAGGKYSDLYESGCLYQQVHPLFYEGYLGSAMSFYGGKQFPILQCLVPDENGKCPTEEGCDPTLAFFQPSLAKPALM